MKKLKNITSKILLILITISLVVFSVIPDNINVYGATTEQTKQDIVDYAISYSDQNKNGKPTPYVWGGNNLKNGADCSGFVMAVFKDFGYNLKLSLRQEEGNSRAAAMSRVGQQVQYSDVELGDIIVLKWTNTSGWSWHCGIYAGNGKYVNCSSAKNKMCATLSSVPTKNVYAVTRIVGNVNGGTNTPPVPQNQGGNTSGGQSSGGYTLKGFKPKGDIDDTDDDPIDLDEIEFEFVGSPEKMTYNGETKISAWLFSKFSQFVDYILGIMVQGLKGAIVGWTAIIEGWINDILNAMNENI